MTDNKKTMPPG